MCVLLLIAILALAGLLYFDYGGARDIFISAFGLEQATRAQYEALQQRFHELEARETDINVRSAKLDDREKDVKEAERASDDRAKELAKQESALAAQEADLQTREQAIETQADEIEALKKEVEAWKTDIAAAAQMYAQMDAKIAAQTLSIDANPAQIARLLMKMDSAKAADILENFSKDLRKDVTDEMAP